MVVFLHEGTSCHSASIQVLSLLSPSQQKKKELVKSFFLNSWRPAERGNQEDGVPFGTDAFSNAAGGGVGCQNIFST